jgi:hypothetical protein
MPDDSLIDQIKRRGTQAKEAAGAAIAGLTTVATDLDLPETAARLVATRDRLQSDTFKLIVMGRFKNGKSTLLNALMGGVTTPVDLAGHKGPMVVDDLPATATLTSVRYSEKPYVTAWHFDDTSERWPLSRYLRESTLDGGDEEENQRRFSHIREFEMGFPARLCQAGVTIYDSPGLDEHASRTLVTRNATALCDAAIIVYRSDALMGQSELMDAATLVADNTRIFTLINLWDKRAVDDKLRGYVWNKYVHDFLEGPKWAHQDPATHDIHFVNAAAARDGRYDADEARVQASGLAEFERRLGDFLVRDRQHAHLAKFTTQAATFGDTIEKHIEQRRQAIRTDQEQLRRTYAEIQPRLATIQERPKRLEKIFTRYRKEAQDVATASFVSAVAGIRRDLPKHLAETDLPSGEKVGKIFRAKTLQREAAVVISDFVRGRVDEWGQKEAPGVVEPVIDRLVEEIKEEIAVIARDYDDIHFELTGFELDARVTGSVVSTTERVLSAAAGLLIGDVTAALTGGAGGYRAAAGGIGAAFGTAFILGALGVVSASIFIPAMLAASLVFGAVAGGKGFEDRVKAKAVEQTDPQLAAFVDELEPKISGKVGEDFALLEKTITEEIVAVVAEETHNITHLVELNQRSQSDREQVLTTLDAAAGVVTEHRRALQRALTTAKQV